MTTNTYEDRLVFTGDMMAFYHRLNKPTIALNIRPFMEMTPPERAWFYELWDLSLEDATWFEDKIYIKKLEDVIHFYSRALLNTRHNIEHGYNIVCDGHCAAYECVCPVKDDETN